MQQDESIEIGVTSPCTLEAVIQLRYDLKNPTSSAIGSQAVPQPTCIDLCNPIGGGNCRLQGGTDVSASLLATLQYVGYWELRESTSYTGHEF